MNAASVPPLAPHEAENVVARLRHPIVLIPGLFGFDELRVGGLTLVRYFRGIPAQLRAAGNSVWVAQVCPSGGIAQRAQQLKQFIREYLPGESLHLIGHSLGGLDSRYMITRLGMAERVLTLTTLGTPHHGTPFADWGIRRLSRVLRPVLERWRIPHQAFYDLTTEQCQQFNEAVRDSPQVQYFSIAGRHEETWRTPQWTLSQRIISQAEGPNDGLVSVASASWGQRLGVWQCDHLGLINWSRRHGKPGRPGKDRAREYARLMHLLSSAER